ncbi:MAG: protoheme IX farnesyltransferase [Myxococcales bacterium]|nr:MAG: protoheme IX farnesyltransferase [Myxococcales bacterium]
MDNTLVSENSRSLSLRDLFARSKPRISSMGLLTTACGWGLAPVEVSLITSLATLLGTLMIVAAANTLNCWLEVEVDSHMPRTANRPLPAGRLETWVALVMGLVLGVASVLVLNFAVNSLTALVGASALFLYVGVYTPLKLKTPYALLIGAIPGAAPPLMGWTAATGRIDLAGFTLFAILFLWQLPHFIAISIFRKDEYVLAGIRVFPWAKGLKSAKRHAAFYTMLLFIASMVLYAIGLVGSIYLTVATLSGTVFLAWALWGLQEYKERRWAKKFFLLSLLYVTLLFPAMVFDAI